MSVLRLLFFEMHSYGAAWLGFVAVAFLAARFAGLPGVLLGHLLVALAVAALDFLWVQTEMLKPGYDGQPDRDFVFVIGVLVRVVLVNTLLLPISVLALRTRRRRCTRASPARNIRNDAPNNHPSPP